MIDLTSTGIVLILFVTVAWGGTFLLRVANGNVPANELQRTYFRAGHAHAGVLLILGLVVRVVTADPRVPEWGRALGDGVLWAALIMSAGFFLSVIGTAPERPNGFRWLILLGAAVLGVSLLGTGVALISAAR